MTSNLIGNKRGNKMGIFTQEPTPARRIQEDRPRDMAKILQDSERGGPIEEVNADQYGKRPTRYEHEDIVLSNEYIAMIEHIDRTVDDLLGEISKLTDYANTLKQAIHVRVVDLTVMVQREKAVVVDLQGHFQDLCSRISAKRNEIVPAARANGNGRAHADSEPASVTTQEAPAAVKDEAVVQPQGGNRGKSSRGST